MAANKDGHSKGQDNLEPRPRFELRLPPERIRALIEGRDADPFAILGPHPVAGGWRVVALDFGATEMSIATIEGVFPMSPVEDAPGLFAVIDRIGPTANLEEHRYAAPFTIPSG